MLKDVIYPFVRDNAEFYASYALPDKSGGEVFFPFTCAQEGCGCRDNTDWYWRWGEVKVPLPYMTKETQKGVWNTGAGEHNAHPDLAFASASFRKAAEYSELLGIDADLRTKWLGLLSRVPAYPTQVLTFLANASGNRPIIGSDLSGKTIMTEASAGFSPTAEAAAKAVGNATVVWPWCNANYPIANFAAMWPTDEMATFDPELFAVAKTTVYAINNYSGYYFKGSMTPYANQNGFGLSWPPAVRVSNTSDAVELLLRFATAAHRVTYGNGIDANTGGMLENMGAAVAINDMLFQSYTGVLRFFPVWDPKALGPASFTTLRAYGAFLVSASIGADGTVSPVTVVSEVGSNCTVEPPWSSLMVRSAAGTAVATTPVSNGMFRFATSASATYTLSSK